MGSGDKGIRLIDDDEDFEKRQSRLREEEQRKEREKKDKEEKPKGKSIHALRSTVYVTFLLVELGEDKKRKVRDFKHSVAPARRFVKLNEDGEKKSTGRKKLRAEEAEVVKDGDAMDVEGKPQDEAVNII